MEVEECEDQLVRVVTKKITRCDICRAEVVFKRHDEYGLPPRGN